MPNWTNFVISQATAKELLLQMQQREIENRNPLFENGFNNVFGYYIEVTKAHKDKAPANWIRKQTLVNGGTLHYARAQRI